MECTPSEKPYESEHHSGYLSLAKVKGESIVDVIGYICNEFGEPTFRLCRIIFGDGSEIYCEGEHDMPYVTDLDQALLEKIDSDNDEDQ